MLTRGMSRKESQPQSSMEGSDTGKAQRVLQIEKFESNTQVWKRWRQRLERSFFIFKITDNTEKTAYLLHCIGAEPFATLCDRLEPEDPYAKSYEDLCKKLEEFYSPEPLEIVEIFTFRKRLQKEGESAQEYMAALQKLSQHCNFGNYATTELRNQFVVGMRGQRIQARLLESPNLTMDGPLKIAISMERVDQGIQQLKPEKGVGGTEQVDFVGPNHRNRKKTAEASYHSGSRPRKGKAEPKKTPAGKGASSVRNKKCNKHEIMCYRCGGDHLSPACSLPKSIECRECGGFSHLKKVCKKKAVANLVEEITVVDNVEEHSDRRASYTVSLSVEKVKVCFSIDCGAAVTLISQDWLKERWPKLKLCRTDLKLRSYYKVQFESLGYVKVKVKDGDTVKLLNMYVVDCDREPLLGREWINQLIVLKKLKESLVEVQALNWVQKKIL